MPPERIELAKASERQLDLISSADLNKLLASPNESTLASLRDKAILELFFSTGLRVSELCSLSRDLDLTRDEFSIRGKGEKVRVVFLSESARTALKEYLAKRQYFTGGVTNISSTKYTSLNFSSIANMYDNTKVLGNKIPEIYSFFKIHFGHGERIFGGTPDKMLGYFKGSCQLPRLTHESVPVDAALQDVETKPDVGPCTYLRHLESSKLLRFVQ